MYFTDHNGPTTDHIEMNFEYFQIQKFMSETECEKNR